MSIDTIIAEMRTYAGQIAAIGPASKILDFADQLSACRTAEGAVAAYLVERQNPSAWEAPRYVVMAGDPDFDMRYRREIGDTVTPLYAHPAKAVPEGEKPEWYRRECDNVDEIIRKLGLDPERVRTEGGALIVQRILNHIQETSDALADASVKLAAVFGTAHPAPVASRVTVDEAMVERAMEAFTNTPARHEADWDSGLMRAALEAALTTPERG